MLANPLDLVRHPGLDVVVEAIGGCGAARTLVLEAIAHGKHVVTANKALLAQHGEEIFAAAARHGVMVAYEGAVAVSIPIVKALREGLAANEVQWVAGIVNGTSNFILTRMRDDGVAFGEALAEAQRLGYAEADPTFDVDGIDAAHKLALLASIAFGMPLRFDAVHTEGISAIAPDDFRCAAALGHAVKLLAVARRSPAGLELRVQPALVCANSLMARVDGAMNSVMVGSDAAGVTMYYGAGAGSEQTASAVVADLVEIARMEGARPEQTVPYLGFHAHAMAAPDIVPVGDVVARHFLRIPVQAGADAQVLQLLAQRDIAVAQQLSLHPGEADAPSQLALLTHAVPVAGIRAAAAELRAMPAVRGSIAALPVEELG
ncbi:homoserine dehydrogenase [Ramlibacter sp.]|uniref:homoserine dehydrogenase n=1 Tax=Ramlibacter sp. TaxID=1917967 RepID=UPI00343DC319